jgi:hypothetical protein
MNTERRFVTLTILSAALLILATTAMAQTTADHEALAHGKPIVNGHPVQPTPDVVQERWRHHELMLKSEADDAKAKLPSPSPTRTKVDPPATSVPR